MRNVWVFVGGLAEVAGIGIFRPHGKTAGKTRYGSADSAKPRTQGPRGSMGETKTRSSPKERSSERVLKERARARASAMGPRTPTERSDEKRREENKLLDNVSFEVIRCATAIIGSSRDDEKKPRKPRSTTVVLKMRHSGYRGHMAYEMDKEARRWVAKICE